MRLSDFEFLGESFRRSGPNVLIAKVTVKRGLDLTGKTEGIRKKKGGDWVFVETGEKVPEKNIKALTNL